MAESGDHFEFPDGSAYILNRAASETDGESVEMEFVLPSDCLPPPPHVHPHQVESYKVLEGNLDILVDETWQTLGPGESASVPVGVSHTFRNSSGEQVRVQNWHKPAMGFEDFIQQMCGDMDRAGIKSQRDPRTLIYMSMAMMDFPETLVPTRKRELWPMKVMAAIGRLTGMGKHRRSGTADRSE